MSTSTNPVGFIHQFIDLIQVYKAHPEKYELQIERREYGQVYIELTDRKIKAAFRNLFTPPQYNPRGSIGWFMPSLIRKACTAAVLSNLFLKTVGLTYDRRLEENQLGELSTLSAVFSDKTVPADLKIAAGHALEQIIPIYQIVAHLAGQDLLSCYKQFVDIPAAQCTLSERGKQAAVLDGKVVAWLWSCYALSPDESQVPEGGDLIQKIVESDDARSSSIRSLALAMSQEVASPIRQYVESSLHIEQQQQWAHSLRYEILLDDSPVVIHHGESAIQGQDEKRHAVRWTVSIHFDKKMCISQVGCSVDSIEGFSPEVSKEITHFCTGQWDRPFLGNIETLFYRPDIQKVMSWEMARQANLFECIEQKEVIFRGKDKDTQKAKSLLHPGIEFLFNMFSVPQEIQKIALYNYNEFDRYLKSHSSPPVFYGALIAVSRLPFEAVVDCISTSHPSISQWEHTCDKIEIIYNKPLVSVVHHGKSMCSGGNDTITWKLEIHLNHTGVPSDLSFTSSVTGHLQPFSGLSVFRCILPPELRTPHKM